MKKHLIVVAALAAGIAGIAGPACAAAETVTLAHSTWVGFGPLYIARDTGTFARNGITVDLEVIEDVKQRFAALEADRIQLVASSVDAALLYLRTPTEFQYLIATDDSRGGDGIVATTDVKTVADLKGKTVAVDKGSVSQFYLDVLLAKARLHESDLFLLNLTAKDAVGAFLAKKVDAAVTWEPWLSQGKGAANGHVVVDSAATPGLIVDALMAKSRWVAAHPKAAAAIVKSWNEAVAYYRAHPDEGIAIMAKGVGGWLKDPKAFSETLSGVGLYGAAENKAFFGTLAEPGPLAGTVRYAIEVWSSHQKLRVQPNATRLINYRFVAGD
ncbi:MAG TPA: ABC transporter substrate-binding protein [Stellaceae bacterium]|jgi:NitT/TauT family transport system substrate-binding protein